MAKITELKNSIVFENDYAEIVLSKKDSAVEKIIDKKTGKDIKGEDTCFFTFETKEEEKIAVTGLFVKGEILTVKTERGSFDIEVKVFDSYFTFEVKTKMPEGIFKAFIAYAKYSYDYTDKKNTAAVGIAMTIWVDPMFYPDGKSCETKGRIYPHLGDVEAKYGLLIAPIVEHHDLLQKMFLTIDKNKGIVSQTGGVWGRDSRLNFGNYIIQHDTSPEYIAKNMPYYKSLGVDQVDLHKGGGTFRQGDFKIAKYDSVEEFKKNVADVFEANGISIGLHTYSWYIEFNCDTILSKPENLHQIGVLNSFTLAEDVDEDAVLFPTVESTDCVSMDRGFCRTNSPFLLIDDELIYFVKDNNGCLKATARGYHGTKVTAHKKGTVVKHLDGHYNGLAPVFGSDLFYQIARNTADLYNKGGFKMIYLDALDGARFHCDIKNEYWFYKTAFAHEVLRHCHDCPILEAADYGTAMYAARGRIGAWDYPYRGYRDWNEKHANDNKNCTDRYLEAILGWYNFFPMTDMYPGNEHTKYQHTDDIEHMGALAVKYDYANVFSGNYETFNRYAGLRRNITLYKKYDDLRKAQYFSEEYRQKLIDCPFEVQLKEKRGGKYTFVEKNYQKKRLYDLSDTDRNKAEYKNPFGAQTPFIRIEAFLSTAKNNPFVLLPLDENKELITQKLEAKYGGELDLSNNLAKVVRVFGNGGDGKICINLRCATNSEQGYAEFIIDTNFKGWREFILLESDNGERKDHSFEKGYHLYAIYRSSFNNNRTTGIDIMTEGDMTGVRMSSVIAYEHTYEILKNPTVKIGDTSVMFECELQSSDFIEFDGKTAKVIDRFANEKTIWFTGDIKAPRGKFKAELTARALNRCTPRAQLTLGFTGKEIK